jgi:hypothetical protein
MAHDTAAAHNYPCPHLQGGRRFCALKYAIFFCEFGFSFLRRKTLTQVCVLNAVC